MDVGHFPNAAFCVARTASGGRYGELFQQDRIRILKLPWPYRDRKKSGTAAHDPTLKFGFLPDFLPWIIFDPASTVSRRREADNGYWVAAVGSVFEVAMCAGIGTLEVASV